MSAEVTSPAADDNNLLRTRAPEPNAEVERVHRKFGDLERRHTAAQQENDELRKQVNTLLGIVTRFRRILWTGFATIEAKAAYGMSTNA